MWRRVIDGAGLVWHLVVPATALLSGVERMVSAWTSHAPVTPDGITILDLDECCELLRTSEIGRLAIAITNHPDILAINYVTNEIRMRTAEIVNEDILPTSDTCGMTDATRRPGLSAPPSWRCGWRSRTLSSAPVSGPRTSPRSVRRMGLDFVAHAYMNEVLAYSGGAAGLFGVVAPNSGLEWNPVPRSSTPTATQ